MNLSMNNGIPHPRHPSLDNLRRNQMNGSRSTPQLETERPEGAGRVRFESDPIEEMSPLDLMVDSIFGAATLVCSMGLLTILVLIFLIVRPFSVTMARRLSAQIGAASFIEAIALLLPNTRIYLTGDSDVPSPVGTSVLVSNHMMDGDWYTILMLGRCVGLRGSVKVFLRNEILHLNCGGAPKSPRGNSPPHVVRSITVSVTSGMIDSVSATQRNSPQYASSNSSSHFRSPTSPDLSMVAGLLHRLLEFPIMNGEDYISNRENLFQMLRSFTDKHGSVAPVHLLVFPEGWSVYNGEDRKAVLARSNEFAKREGRPQLKHLLLPRTTGFNASLDSLRESSPVVYDVTMAYRGYDGSLPPKYDDLSILSLWSLLRRKYPEEIHIRIKRYSIEEVLQDASWLDKKWAEKDRLLHHFARHQSFPPDSRGFARHRVFDTRFHSVETSIVSLVRLLLLPCAVPVLLFLSIPILWTVAWAWLVYTAYKYVFPDPDASQATRDTTAVISETGQTPRCDSAAGTPFFPATPFASPSISNWRDVLANQNYEVEEM